MAPKWSKFQTIVQKMIETELIGGETCTVTIPSTISYDYDDGEVVTGSTTTSFKTALIKTNKDDLVNLPEGLRDKVTKKVYTVNPLVEVNAITSSLDGVEYKIIVPSSGFHAGGLTHAYVTFLGKVETQE